MTKLTTEEMNEAVAIAKRMLAANADHESAAHYLTFGEVVSRALLESQERVRELEIVLADIRNSTLIWKKGVYENTKLFAAIHMRAHAAIAGEGEK